GGMLWSFLEWPQLLATGRVHFATASSYGLFVASHVSLGLFAAWLCAIPLLVVPLGLLGPPTVHHRRRLAIIWIATFQIAIGLVGLRFAFAFRARSLILVVAVGVAPLMLMGRVLVDDLFAWSRCRHPGHTRSKAVLCVLALIAVHVVNYTFFPKHYFVFHVALVVFAAQASVLAACYGLSAWPVSAVCQYRKATALTLVAVLLPFGLVPLRNSVRHALFVNAFDAKAVLYLGRKLTDVDR